MVRWSGIGRAFRKGQGGIPARQTDDQLISDLINSSMRVGRRERVMRANGSQAMKLVFESQGAVLNTLIIREVTQALSSISDYIRILNVVPRQVEETGMVVDVVYQPLTQGATAVPQQTTVALQG